MSDSLGLWKLAAPRLKRGCFLPGLTFQRKARRHGRKRGIACEVFKPELFYGVAVVAYLLRLSLLSQLQQGVFHEVQMMRLAWMRRPWPEPRGLRLCDRQRFRVRCHRLRPQPKHGISMRGHVLGMLSRRGDLGISVGGIKTALRQRRVIVGVDQIVQRARMVR